MKVHGAGPSYWSAASLDGTIGVVRCEECGRLCVPRNTDGKVFPRRHRQPDVRSRPWCPGVNVPTSIVMISIQATDPL